MVMPSVSRRMSISLASAADLATWAVEIISNALAMAGIGPPGRFLLTVQRVTSSLQPPQPGSTPTPTSTSPA